VTKRRPSAAGRGPGSAPPVPPSAPRRPEAVTHGRDVRIDEYHWLRDPGDPDARAYIEAENAYAEAILKPHAGLVDRLYLEMKQRYREDDEEVPERIGDYYYYRRTPRGCAYEVLCRRKDSLAAPEEVVLDLNRIAAETGARYLKTGEVEVGPDHALLALTIDFTGDERFTLLVIEACSEGAPLLSIEGTSPSLAWAGDSRTIFYCRVNAAGQPTAVHRRRVDEEGTDIRVYEEDSPGFFVRCSTSRSGRFVFVTTSSNITDEVRFVPADEPEAPLELVRPRVAGIEYQVVHHGRYFYVITNLEAPNYRLMRAPIGAPTRWREFLPHRAEILLEGVEAFRDHLVLLERRRGLQRLRILDLSSGRRTSVQFPEPSYAITVLRNPAFETRFFRFAYSSPLTPRTVYDYDMSVGFMRPRKVAEVKQGYDPANYHLERVLAPAADGARIPITLLCRRGIRKNGKNPLYLYGYGSYGSNASPAFSAERFSLVDRGFVFAIAHVRGGQELGRAWYDDGRLLRKRNTFDDFIACTEYLIRTRWTSEGLVAAAGASAGGLLVGAVANMRPELYRTILTHVPFVDVLNTMLDPGLNLTVFEYDEWGDPNQEAYYQYIASYSPYDNVRAQAYPHILVLGAYNDPRVPCWEAAKWTARLRAHKTDDNLLLLRTFTHAGHGGRSGRFEALRETALEYGFLFLTFGITPRFDVRET